MVQTLLNLLATAFYYLFHRLELLQRLRHPIHRELALQPSELGCLTTLCQIYRLVSETALDLTSISVAQHAGADCKHTGSHRRNITVARSYLRELLKHFSR